MPSNSLTDQTDVTAPGPYQESCGVEALLTVHEVAGFLRVRPSWVYERTRRRGRDRLPHIKVGKYLRFRPGDVETYLEALRRG